MNIVMEDMMKYEVDPRCLHTRCLGSMPRELWERMGWTKTLEGLSNWLQGVAPVLQLQHAKDAPIGWSS
ncbi:hypothetical protein Pfo_022373 [Paulownia fortunei]|nr:hypothetical protein Pfo_022373 [Paulownia fortunei]